MARERLSSNRTAQAISLQNTSGKLTTSYVEDVAVRISTGTLNGEELDKTQNIALDAICSPDGNMIV